MNEQLDVKCEKLVYGGSGLARLENGQAVFVRGLLPGERALVRVLRKRKGFLEAEPVKVITPSEERITPPCLGDKECTGATWSHISYAAQLGFKQEILVEALKKISAIVPDRLLPIIPSAQTEHYRLRTQFTVRVSEGKQRIGFFRPGTYDLIEVENAFLLHPLINNVLRGIRIFSDRLPPLKEIHINVSPANEAHILFFTEEKSYPPMDIFFDDLRKTIPHVVGITGFADRKKAFTLGKTYLTLEIEGLTLHATEGNFYQVNWEQNRNMVKTVLEFAELKGNETVLDLYCGIGNFSLPLARKAKNVIGVESGYSAIEDAKENAGRNNLRNTEFIADDMEKGLKQLIKQKMRADVIILDPPRAGATLKTVERVLAFVPKKIIYVSCNPTTLARDLKFFRLFGFRLDRLQPIDMFPYTYHIECVAEMVRGE